MKILILQGSYPAHVLRQQTRQREEDGVTHVILLSWRL